MMAVRSAARPAPAPSTGQKFAAYAAHAFAIAPAAASLDRKNIQPTSKPTNRPNAVRA